MKTVIIIPARLESTRLPNKLLLDLGGKSILQRVFEQCKKAAHITEVYIAVDDIQLKNHCIQFTPNVILTSKKHQSGTDRITEALKSVDCDAVINVQGDEPFIDPDLINDVSSELKNEQMVSVKCAIHSLEEINDPNNVKVVTNRDEKAIYFSRAPIPFNRDGDFTSKELKYYKHLGIYGYTKKFLIKFSKMKPTFLEITEKLEQLRVLENGFSIKMITTTHNAIGIDTLEDYEKAKILIENN